LAMLFITHNLGIVAEQADRVVVLYAGRVMEEGPVAAVFQRPRHPYTRALIASIPGRDLARVGKRQRLRAIGGQVPSPFEMPKGCPFADRCEKSDAACACSVPELVEVGAGHRSRCRRWQEL
ncbi:MAG: ABC transporter ATP-binding protein, partial [Proteobacteria bacterium]|nr:ABC transporter ATP-binding protein [Pseudomonadota bacterium]